MCIRDRIEEQEDAFSIGCMCTLRQLEMHEALNLYFGGAMKACTRPVSYTHLDVYKRQAYNRALTAAKKALTQETIKFIKETFGDLDSYLKPMIEAQVRSQKTYM